MKGGDYILVSIKQLSIELSIDRSYLRKYIKSNGFPTFKSRTEDSRSQLALCVNDDIADKIREYRKDRGFALNTEVDDSKGYFYLILLYPDLSDKRVKLGFTNDVRVRLSQHRTTAPTAKLIKYWGCKRAWEPAAIDCATRMCTPIGQEVFDIDNMDFVISRLDSFFTVMS